MHVVVVSGGAEISMILDDDLRVLTSRHEISEELLSAIKDAIIDETC